MTINYNRAFEMPSKYVEFKKQENSFDRLDNRLEIKKKD